MDKIYYLNINNKNLGPYSKEDIFSKIASGTLNEYSFIFIKGTKNWVLLPSISFFKEALDKVSKNIVKRWFVHKNKNNYGPYSINDLINLVQIGQFDIDDYTWSKGLDKWLPLRELDELCKNNDIDDTKEKTEISSIPPSPNTNNTNNNLKNNMNTNKTKEASKKKPRVFKLVPEFFLSAVLFYFARLVDNNSISVYLYILAIVLLFVFLVFNFIARRN